jgi:hypothetical protein
LANADTSFPSKAFRDHNRNSKANLTKQGIKHLREILRAKGDFIKVPDKYGTLFLEKS